jgi:DNA-binding LytR/AlgR family response regulator
MSQAVHYTSTEAPFAGSLALPKLNTVVVEDDPVQTELLRHLVRHIPELGNVKFCSSSEEAIGVLSAGSADLLLLDIGLPGLSGFQLLDELPTPPQVIITTGDDQHALEGFERGVVDLLVKPFTLERLLRSVRRAAARASTSGVQADTVTEVSSSSTTLSVRSGRRTLRIPAAAVLMAEALGNHVKLHLKDRIIVVNCTMKRMESELPTDRFIRVHRSYFIAIEIVLEVISNTVFTKLGEVPLGALYRKNLRDRLASGQ